MRYPTATKKISAWACLLAVAATTAFGAISDEWSPETIKGHMKKLAEWQLANPKKHHKRDWTYGAFYAGMAAYGNIDPSGPGFPSIREVGAMDPEWGFLKRLLHADDHCIGQAYIETGIHDKNQAALKSTTAHLDKVIAETDTKQTMEFGKKGWHNRWSWVDALFMSPTVFTKAYGVTGDEKYLDFMDREVKATFEYLYDKSENLFYRDSRYFDAKTPAGNKMFWSRGNGWAFAAMPIILTDMPKNWKNRAFYERIFTQMAPVIKKCQAPDGSWHPSLHDQKNPDIIDMSASMFMTYGLMWGVNNGYLSESEYLPAIKKAWSAACACVNDDGALGWVQPIADKPYEYKADSTEVYGSGAFLLAASEIYKYTIKKAHPGLKTVQTVNELPAYRQQETVTIPLSVAKDIKAENLRIFDARNGRVIPHQIVDDSGDGQLDSIIFQADIMARSTRDFWIFGSDTLPAAPSTVTCYSRHVPERMDDFAWENDLTAYRCYGPALMQPPPRGEGLVSSGIDIWCKRVKTPIVDKFYKSKAYHKDNGEGMDFYKVGKGRGCGGTSWFTGNKPYVSKNWAKAANVTNGPIRTVFELEYEPWSAGGKTIVAEKRRVTLDAGSWYMRNQSTLTVQNKPGKAGFGPGLDIDPKHQNDGKIHEDAKNGIICVWGQGEKHDINGSIASALITLDPGATIKKDAQTISLALPVGNKPLVWYTGSTWERAGYITSEEEWIKAANHFAARLKSPLKTSLKK